MYVRTTITRLGDALHAWHENFQLHPFNMPRVALALLAALVAGMFRQPGMLMHRTAAPAAALRTWLDMAASGAKPASATRW